MIDLRSDTVTRPTPAMREAMACAEVGDDVFRDDPTVLALERRVAEILGKEAGLFVPTGTQSNLCALLAHCQRGEEYIVSGSAHMYRYEAGGGAVLGSIQPQPVEPESDGTLDLDKLRAAIKPDDEHFAITRLVCLENTTGGRPLPPDYVADVQSVARAAGLSLHLDGARLFNAAVACELPPRQIAAGFDTVSVCMSKGLGAPAGSVLTGRRDLVDRARRWRKMLGGAMRQSGVLAAAGLYALDHHVDRLADDHRRAREFARLLGGIDAIVVDPDVPSNMVFVRVPQGTHESLAAFMLENDVILYAPSDDLRLVLHLDIDDEAVGRAAELFARFYA